MKIVKLHLKSILLFTLFSWISTYAQNNGLMKISKRNPNSSNIRITAEELEKTDTYKTDYILLDFTHSLRITNHHITIKVINPNSKNATLKFHSEPAEKYKEEKKNTIIDTTFNISFTEYQKAIQLFKNISSKDIIDEKSNIGLPNTDGTHCKIEYGNNLNSVSYYTWSPDNQTEKRKLNSFLACFEYLRKLSKMSF